MEQLRLFSLFLSLSLRSTFISGSVHDILVLVACLFLQRFFYQFTHALDEIFFSFSHAFTATTDTPLDHALAVKMCVIVVHPLKNEMKKEPARARMNRRARTREKCELNPRQENSKYESPYSSTYL